MDEPLSNLDAKLRVQTRTQIASLQRRLGTTTVYVTHDQVEAMTMGDRVAVLKDGILQQCDSPRHMYDKPNNVFVAGFIGSPAMNLLADRRGRATRCTSAGPTCGCPGRRPHAVGSTRSVTVGVRPEDMDVVGDGAGMPHRGGGGRGARRRRLHLWQHRVQRRARKSVIVRVDGRRPPAKGDVLYLAPRPGHVHMFSGETGERVEL